MYFIERIIHFLISFLRVCQVEGHNSMAYSKNMGCKLLTDILFNFGKAAGKTVAETAKQLKTTVEEKVIF